MREHLRSENTAPSSLFSHPSITILNKPSISFPATVSAAATPMSINAKATTLSTCSEPCIYCDSHMLAAVENRKERYTPARIETIAITWAMNPFLSP